MDHQISLHNQSSEIFYTLDLGGLDRLIKCMNANFVHSVSGHNCTHGVPFSKKDRRSQVKKKNWFVDLNKKLDELMERRE